MKKLVLFIMIVFGMLLSNIGYSQDYSNNYSNNRYGDNYLSKKFGEYYMGNRQISYTEYRDLLENCPASSNALRNQRIGRAIGDVVISFQTIACIVGLTYWLYYPYEPIGPILTCSSLGAMLITCIPLAANNCDKHLINTYNNYCQKYRASIGFGSTRNGIGMIVKF